MGPRAVQALGSGRPRQKEGWARKVVLGHQWLVWALYRTGAVPFDKELATGQLSPPNEFDAAAHAGRNDRSVLWLASAVGLAAEQTDSAFVVVLNRFASRTRVTVLPKSCLPGCEGHLACGSPFLSRVEEDHMVVFGMNAAKAVLWFSLVLFLGLNNACAAEGSARDYQDLKLISFFGSISVSVHFADSATPAKSSALSSEELTQFMRVKFARYFSGIPFRSIDASRWSDEENRRAMGRFSCRVWIEGDDSPVAYQVKCQISTSDHLNIIEDASLGYGPKDKVAAIVRQQIDRMVESFALIFSRIRSQ